MLKVVPMASSECSSLMGAACKGGASLKGWPHSNRHRRSRSLGLVNLIARTAALDSLQELIDAIGATGGVGFKVQFGDTKQVQAFGDLAAEEMARAIESLDGLLLLV